MVPTFERLQTTLIFATGILFPLKRILNCFFFFLELMINKETYLQVKLLVLFDGKV